MLTITLSFFLNVKRIGSSEYLPTAEDVLRARLKSTGITETRFTMGQLQFVASLFLPLLSHVVQNTHV